MFNLRNIGASGNPLQLRSFFLGVHCSRGGDMEAGNMTCVNISCSCWENARLRPFMVDGEARVLESHGMRIVDAGVCEGAINIDPPPEGHWMLQDAIDRWRQQAYVHAIVEVPSWLVLRINRFQQDASAGVTKIRSPMQWAAECLF